jgi:hypothetical protein
MSTKMRKHQNVCAVFLRTQIFVEHARQITEQCRDSRSRGGEVLRCRNDSTVTVHRHTNVMSAQLHISATPATRFDRKQEASGSSVLSAYVSTGVSPVPRTSHVITHVTQTMVKKGKAVPLQAWTGPQGSRRSRLPDF